jgi:hypothetical protein
MTRGLNIDLSVDGVLSYQIQPTGVKINPTLQEEYMTKNIGNASLLSSAELVLFVLTIFALALSNNEPVHSACGRTLWDMVLVDIVLHVMIGSIGVLLMWGAKRYDKYRKYIILVAFILCICLTVGLFVLGTYNVLEGKSAMENTKCNSAMRGSNMETPLLAIVAITNGAFMLLVAVIITIYFIWTTAMNEPG